MWFWLLPLLLGVYVLGAVLMALAYGRISPTNPTFWGDSTVVAWSALLWPAAAAGLILICPPLGLWHLLHRIAIRMGAAP